MNKNTETKQIKICTWNVCLGILHKIQLIKEFVLEKEIDVLCIQEAEIKMDDDISLLGIQGFSLELEKTSQMYSRRTLIYIRESMNYERMSQFEKEDAHVICIKIPAENMCLASIYRTYKLTHKNSHLVAIEEQIFVLNQFMSLGMDIIIMGMSILTTKRKTTTATT